MRLLTLLCLGLSALLIAGCSAAQLGSQLPDGSAAIERADIDVEVTDLAAGLATIRESLKAAGAPAGTEIQFERDGQPVTEKL